MRSVARLALAVLAIALGGCASAPRRWEPELTPELRESCRKAPLECRQAAEKLAADWTTDDEAFGALKAFTGACQAGDAESCAAIDRRFTRLRYLGDPPAPPYPKAAREERLEGTWATTCTFTRTGEVTGCTVERPIPELGRPFLEWIQAGPWQAPTLDGRSRPPLRAVDRRTPCRVVLMGRAIPEARGRSGGRGRAGTAPPPG